MSTTDDTARLTGDTPPDASHDTLEALAELDPEQLHDALVRLLASAAEPDRAATVDDRDGCHLDDPGAELEPGQDGMVQLDELPAVERIIGTNNLLGVHFLAEGAEVQRAVCRVRLGHGFGTGWLVSPSLMITNNHVIRDEATARTARAEFNHQSDHHGAAQTIDSYRLDPNSFFITNAALDYTVVRVRPKLMRLSAPLTSETLGGRELVAVTEDDELEPTRPTLDRPPVIDPTPRIRPPRLPWLWLTPGSRWGHIDLPATGPQYARNQYYNVIGHPRARRKEVSLQDNKVTRVFTNVVHYTTDTDPGSSGSPVFNNDWDVVALHHAAGERRGGVWVSNEGIRIDKVVAHLRANAPSGIRGELGI